MKHAEDEWTAIVGVVSSEASANEEAGCAITLVSVARRNQTTRCTFSSLS